MVFDITPEPELRCFTSLPQSNERRMMQLNLRFRMEENVVRHLLFFALAAAIVVGIGYQAQSQSANNVVVKVKTTPTTGGKQLYVNYCAPCHGVDAKGDGPVASSLKQPTPDLTVLSKNNGGKFPSERIVAVLNFGMANPAHGTAAMPIWGPMLSTMSSSNDSHGDLTALRISNLSDYLKSLQVK